MDLFCSREMFLESMLFPLLFFPFFSFLRSSLRNTLTGSLKNVERRRRTILAYKALAPIVSHIRPIKSGNYVVESLCTNYRLKRL